MHIRLAFLCLVLAAMAACAGAGRSIPATGAIGSAGSQSAHRSGVSLRMVIPNTTQIVSARTKHPAFVSASVVSIVYEITQGTASASLVAGPDYTNVNATPAPCTTSAGGLVCTISIQAAIASSGIYTVTIATYDAAQSATCTPGGVPACSGNLLGIASLPETITLGSSTALGVTLGGVPAAVQPISLSAFANGSGHNNANNALTVYGPQPQVGKIELLDAGGNVIINPGAPQVTATSQVPSALTVAVATPPASSGVYTVTFSPVLSGSYVQPGTYPVALDIAVPNSTANYAFNVAVQVAHSAIVVSTCNASYAAAVYGYLDGNTNGSSPDLTISNLSSCTGFAAPGLGTDADGYLYVADGAHLSYYALAPGTNPAPLATANAVQGLVAPTAVALDRDGFTYVADQSNGLVVFPAPTPGGTSFGSVVATIPAAAFSGSLTALAVDGSGDLYAVDPVAGSAQIDFLPSEIGGLNNSSSPSPIASFGPPAYGAGGALAIDVQPNPSSTPDLWFAAEAYPSGGALWQFAPAGGLPMTPIATYTSGLQQIVDGIAIDSAGVVYAATGSALFQVTELTPPAYAPGVTIVPPALSPVSIGVAVVPAAGNSSNNNGGGSPSPIATASPLAIRTRP